jgi:REP element-mobilizing transposase RayT
MKQYLDLVQHVMENGCQKEIVQVLEQKRIRISDFNLQDGFLWLLLKITPKIDYIQLLWFLKEIPI